MTAKTLATALPLTVTDTNRMGCTVISKKNITKLAKNYDITPFTSKMLPFIPISLFIIKVSCIYMHIPVFFTSFADTGGTAAHAPTTPRSAKAIAHARVYINKV